mmetsp:Transcript_25058/g.49026  ORF Transcript_25058/g.49026 Transcript_25058/m.49026 type:complete len:247 (-) Transcript_25058:63-803(-)
MQHVWPWKVPCFTAGLVVAVAGSEQVFRKGWSPFVALNLPETPRIPSKAVLKRAHRKAALRWHPDRCEVSKDKCHKKMASINVANDILSDERKLQQWQAQRNERRGSPKRHGGSGKRHRSHFGGNDFDSFSGGGFDPFGDAGFNFDFGERRRPKRATPGRKGPRASSRPTPPPPPPPPRPREDGWKVVKSVQERRGEATVTTITRELPAPGGKQIKIEISERTCYDAVAQCGEKVIERLRRKRTEL